MVKKIACFVFGLFLIMPMVLAAQTEITVKTTPNYRVSLAILASEEVYSLLESVHTKAGPDGIAQVNYTSTNNEFKLGITIRFAEEKISYDVYGPFSNKNPIYIDTITGEVKDSAPAAVPTNITNESIAQNTSENLLINQTENNSSNILTGKFVSVIKNNKTTIFYIIGGIFLAGVIVFFVMRFKRMPRQREEVKVKKLSDIQKEKEESENEDQRIKQLQNQIYAAQKSINEIKNKDKIQEVRRKLERDKKELEELESGGD